MPTSKRQAQRKAVTKKAADKKAVAKGKARARSMVTPSSGTGSTSPNAIVKSNRRRDAAKGITRNKSAETMGDVRKSVANKKAGMTVKQRDAVTAKDQKARLAKQAAAGRAKARKKKRPK